MFERFTDRSRRVLVLAQEEARLLDHNFIGTEHLLLGLIHEGEGVAARVLESLDISLERARARLDVLVGPGAGPSGESPPFTPRAKKVLELALREALQLGHNYIGTEHLLLGLVREAGGVGSQIIVDLGVDLVVVRTKVLEMLGDPPDRPGPPGDAEGRRSWRRRGPEPVDTMSFEEPEPEPERGAVPRCPVCRWGLAASSAYRLVEVTGPDEAPALSVALVYCTRCGATLGSHEPPASRPAD